MTTLPRGLALALVGALAGSSPRAESSPTIAVERGELIVRTSDGRVRRSYALVGANVQLGELELRLESVTRVRTPRGSVVLHDFALASGDGELCLPDAQGERWAIAFSTAAGIELACTSGARGKCARFGYDPGDPELVDLHAACVRMMRADYGGDGTSATRAGVGIRFCDRAGVWPCPADARVASSWSSQRAECVAQARAPEVADLPTLVARHPHLQGRASCDAETSEAHRHAILFELAPAP